MTTNEDYKLPLTTPDPTREVVERLRETAPHLFAEGKIDFDKLKELLGGQVEQGTERYGLSWAGKAEAFRNVQTPSVATLLPMSGESVDWDNTENLIIEGDNLEVLKLLQKPYHGKVKMIYIDPPYNTGNEFIYPDNFREGLQDYLRYSGQVSEEGIKQSTNTETSGRFHSNWLSMMYPRLFLARNLLKDDGVIFVSIDDNEVHNLRMLMNEVFGEENRIECFVWKKSYGGGAKERFAVTQHEYVLLYARNIQAIDSLWLPPDKDAEEKYYKFSDERLAVRGPYRIKPLEATKSMDRRDNLVYAIPAPDDTEVWPKRQWWWSKDRVLKALEDNEIVFTKTSEGYSVSYKQYLKDEDGKQRGAKPFSIIDGIYTQNGTSDLAECFDGISVLQFPKPVEMIKKLICVGDADTKDGIVLDFFAGSGTTAQAVTDLNREDNGNRKFILVQLPEKTENPAFPTIADITRERVRRVIEKLNKDDEGKLDLTEKQDRGFRAFKLSSSNFKIWDADHAPATPDALAEQLKLYADNIEHLRDQQDILYELILKTGKPLSSRIEFQEIDGVLVYSVSEGQLLICLENPITKEILRGMMGRKPSQILCLDTAFGGDDALKTNTVLEAKSHGVVFRTA
jgi:adenine-specific DNA-methyltransferase